MQESWSWHWVGGMAGVAMQEKGIVMYNRSGSWN